MLSDRGRTRGVGRSSAAAVLLLAALAGTEGVDAQEPGRGALGGTVRSESTGDPLGGARVRALTSGRTAVVASDGSFRLDGLEAGEHRVRVSYLGSETEVLRIDVRPGYVTELTVELAVEPIDLPVLEVEAVQRFERGKLAGFYRRRKRRGAGRFLTREEIEEAPGNDLRHVFRTVPGVDVARCGGRAPGCWALVGRGCSSVSEVTYYVDGARVPLVSGTGVGLGQIPASDVEAIEVYTGPAGVPPQWAGVDGGCVVSIWTRTGGG